METTVMHTSVDHHKMIETKDYDVSLENLNTIFSEIYNVDRQTENESIAIDTMIVQVVDMVKTHLLYAVREEFDMLKEKIVHLENKVARLESENKILRQFAPSDVVAQMENKLDIDNAELDSFINGYSL